MRPDHVGGAALTFRATREPRLSRTICPLAYYVGRMPWSRKLTRSFALIDGRTVATLADVRAFMMSLPERHLANGHWLYAGELVLKAAEPDATADDLEKATNRIEVALEAERAIKPPSRPKRRR